MYMSTDIWSDFLMTSNKCLAIRLWGGGGIAMSIIHVQV